jgi:hypothetical protein
MTQVTSSAAEEARKDCCAQAPGCNTEGFAARFECRPEYRLGRDIVADVINASTVRQRTIDDLMVVRISEVLTANDEVFLGFGIPNSYLVVPKQSYDAAKGESPYQKFAGKSLFREPSTIQDTRGWVQSGMWIRLKGLPPEAAERLREAMQYYNGKRFVTCVRACMYVMQRAGFGSGSKPLRKHKWPYPLLAALTADGLTYEGKAVAFDVVRTSPLEMHNFGFRVWQATLMTFCRHAKRNKAYEAVKTALAVPFRALSKPAEKPSAKRVVPAVAPALPSDVEYLSDIRIGVSKPSSSGALLRLVWGAHALFTAEQTRVNPDHFFSKPLPPFPQEHPDRLTRIKKKVLFAPLVTRFITSMLAPEFVDIGARSESNVYDMLRTHSDEAPAKYNLVVTRKRIMLSHVTTPSGALTLRGKIARKLAKTADWILSKHVLMSNYDPEVFFAAEVWKDADGVIHINRNSGTYQPKDYHHEAALKYAHAVFPHWRIVADV